MSRITVEHFARVYDDDHGWYVQVGPDPDGLGLCSIQYVEGDGRPIQIIVPWAHAAKLASAIAELSEGREDQP